MQLWEASTGCKASDNTAIILCAIGKVFVGELVEAGKAALALHKPGAHSSAEVRPVRAQLWSLQPQRARLRRWRPRTSPRRTRSCSRGLRPCSHRASAGGWPSSCKAPPLAPSHIAKAYQVLQQRPEALQPQGKRRRLAV